MARKFFIALFICERVNILSLDCVFSYFVLLETNFYLKTNHLRSLLIKCLVGKRTPDCTCQTVHKIPELARSTAEQLAELVVYKKRNKFRLTHILGKPQKSNCYQLLLEERNGFAHLSCLSGDILSRTCVLKA